MKKIITLLIIIIIIIGLVFLWKYKFEEIVLKEFYPIKYSEYVEKYASKYNIDPLLIYSIIKAESNFKPDVKSSSDAYGLMQVTKESAKDVAKKLDTKTTNTKMLYDPKTNIKIGVTYFNFLLEKYDYNTNIAVIAYNAGFGNVDKWIQKGIIKEDGQDLENVPFKETNNYVRKILNNYEIYKKLYWTF